MKKKKLVQVSTNKVQPIVMCHISYSPKLYLQKPEIELQLCFAGSQEYKQLNSTFFEWQNSENHCVKNANYLNFKNHFSFSKDSFSFLSHKHVNCLLTHKHS